MSESIVVEGVWKRFRAPGSAPRTLKEWLLGKLRPAPAAPAFLSLIHISEPTRPY